MSNASHMLHLLVRVGKRILDLVLSLAIFAVIIFGVLLIVSRVVQELPTAYQVFSTNVQVIVGLAELVIAFAIAGEVFIEGSGFLWNTKETTFIT